MSRFVRRVAPPVLFVSSLAAAQAPLPPPPTAPPAVPSPVAADVVVTAEARPEPGKTLGVAATVIDAAEIDRSRTESLPDLLRTVPGADVVQSGGPGTVTSLFLRGTNSTQALVLLDGVKLNSPFFGGTDLSALAAGNVERIEVVRGPFSALWGSEAIGGVVQLFTRRAPEGKTFSARILAGAGNDAGREALADAAVREGAFAVTAGWRRVTGDGELPNEYFDGTSWSGSVEATLGEGVLVGAVLRRDEGKTGIPFVGTRSSPRRLTTSETTTLAVPVTISLGAGTSLDVAGTFSKDRPTLSDPDDPFGYTHAETDARRAGGRLVLSHDFGSHRLSVGGDYERTTVTSSDSFGVELDGNATHTWAAFAEDRIALSGEKLVLTAGLRQDEHSAFGGATSPRATLAWAVSPVLKLRLAGGAAFRSPTTGELYYPFSGNPDLKPERSRAYEAGAEVSLARGLVFEASYFRNDIRDLIEYVPQTFTNENVGRARTQGVETALRGDLGEGFFARASYTYLDARDLDTELPLLRRPWNRVSATLGKNLSDGSSFEATARFVGSRPDLSQADFLTRVSMPSYFTFDAAATLPPGFLHLAPYVRVTNILGRAYEEASGFPAPGRRFLAGLLAAF